MFYYAADAGYIRLRMLLGSCSRASDADADDCKKTTVYFNTLGRLFSMLDTKEFYHCLANWVASL
ncbi:hypothetical protein HG15A2_23840 [Adhaeretor mobilis]|uniref:Uncharacterized protein n=1 Tax=Adhaeretor mobilis TaxID=1930276 RepID=A0A517MW35_9BACT|nr:hypothetical protein HG15A2_23840 [Adhaeretor mobilis]